MRFAHDRYIVDASVFPSGRERCGPHSIQLRFCETTYAFRGLNDHQYAHTRDRFRLLMDDESATDVEVEVLRESDAKFTMPSKPGWTYDVAVSFHDEVTRVSGKRFATENRPLPPVGTALDIRTRRPALQRHV